MPIGNDKKKADRGDRATQLRFDGSRIVVCLTDGREVSVPLARYPTLIRATPTDRENWELLGNGRGFYWKSLDLDLSTEGLVQGLPERIPRAPSLKSVKGDAARMQEARFTRKRRVG